MTQFHKNNITPAWQDLVNEFPEIFLELSEEVQALFDEYHDIGSMPRNIEDVCNLRYGFECNIGWKNLIWKFCEKVRELSKKAEGNGHEAFYKSFILKEKFASLRDQGDWLGKDRDLYMDEYRAISHEMESATALVCEGCGCPASQVKIRGWCKTLCDVCVDELRKKSL